MKKTAVYLLLLSILAQLVSCSPATDSATPESADDTTEVISTEETRPSHNLPDNLDFDGADFQSAFFEGLYDFTEVAFWIHDPDYYFIDELTGDNMNDAVYRRTKKAETILDVKFSYQEMVTAEEFGALYKAGDDIFQFMYVPRVYCVANFVTSGYLYNVENLPYVDLTADWYNAEQMDVLRMGKNTYYVVSDFNISNPGAIFFNWNLIKDNNFENPYTLVKEGKWTADKMVQMALDVRNDKNGDGEYSSVDDILGIYIEEPALSSPYLPGCNLMISQRNEETGRHEMILNNEKTYAALDKLYRLYEAPGAINYQQVDFSYGTSLFSHSYTSELEIVGEITGFDIGIVPFPKFDESQNRYYSLETSGLFAIASTIKNPEMVGAVLEYLAWESGNEVVDTYYNKLLKTRYAANLEMREMVQLIFDTVVYDPCGNYFGGEEGFCGFYFFPAETLLKGVNYYAAYFRKEKSFTKKTLEKFYTALEAVEGTAASE